MGGRIHGFLGGVLLASSLTYYTGEYIKKNASIASRSLQMSDDIINKRMLSTHNEWDDVVPVTSKVEFIQRPFAESCKDIWNQEIITAVNWLYSINWYRLGEKADESLNKLTDKLAHSAYEKKQ
ncbi:hypothetical protein DIURU_002075 [Diutina rugosa]|uniref:MICOS complex subunit MIC12 n=1 Tax=Diutina rugosa TaxID=5481 RepID=A0A642URR0_DIURU|nr:uncharacterized protein DIURU_002075 [Diutina rugosa]KAA8904123.1 hypothetical protein DIURU_002075 [Diutina rugosa]